MQRLHPVSQLYEAGFYGKQSLHVFPASRQYLTFNQRQTKQVSPIIICIVAFQVQVFVRRFIS